jgi:hypothetical protein
MQKVKSAALRLGAWIAVVALAVVCAIAQTDPLPSWNDAGSKRAIIAFVEKVTREGSSDFVPVDERIATFDNDGTLWIEQPMYVQLAFVIDRVRELRRANEPMIANLHLAASTKPLMKRMQEDGRWWI